MDRLTKYAGIIGELLANAGWLDDADELLDDFANHEGVPAAVEKAKLVQALIDDINPYVEDKLDYFPALRNYIEDNS